MSNSWVKSLQCKSNAMDDVSCHPKPSPFSKKKPLFPLDCGNPSHALRDVVVLFPKHPPPSKKPPPPSSHNAPPPKSKPKPKPKSKLKPSSPPSQTLPPPRKCLPTLTELPAGHSSRRVVEIIFGSSWAPRGAPFPGEIEMLFRVHNPPRTVARFEDYRAAVRAAAEGAGDARCAADGNEMMRFHCAPSSSSAAADDAIYDAGVVASEGAVRTFAGSGGAHESGGGGGGRRAMLVCRVIAGRVRSGPCEPGRFESVSIGRGELLVLDPRAVLPCFLIIYKL